MDNTTGMFYMSKQGDAHSSPLCWEALNLWDFCVAHSIHLEASYLPEDQNELADRLSCSFDRHEWSLRANIALDIFQR